MESFNLKILLCMSVILFAAAMAASGAAPANDLCTDALHVGEITNLPFDTTEATFDGIGACFRSPNIWYVYTPTGSGNATISLCGSDFDTVLAVYDGSNCPASNSRLLGCNDDACDQQSEITLPVVAGQQYLIEIGSYSTGYSTEPGEGVLTITNTGGGGSQPPVNDDCQDALWVGEVTNLAFDTTYASYDGPSACVRKANIWYVYTPTSTGNTTISLCGSQFDTMLAVYSGNTCPATSSRLLGCNDNSCGDQSQLTIQVVAGQKYLIEIGSYGNDKGSGVLTITNAGGGGAPANDNCQNAQQVNEVTNLSFNTTQATFDGPGVCQSGPNIWYVYTPTLTGDATVSLCGSQFDTVLAVYSGNACPATSSRLLGCNDDSCSYQSEITLSVVAGQKYLVEVGSYGSDKGEGVLTITNSGGGTAPANDDCRNARQIGDVANLLFDTTNATFDGTGACMNSPNIWYIYTASCTGDVTVSLCGSQYDTMLAVYSGSTCSAFSSRLLGCNDDSCSYQSEVTFAAVAGRKYTIEVGGYDSDTGQGVLTVTCGGGVPNPSDLGDAPDSTNNVGSVMTAYPMGGALGIRANYPTVYDDGTSNRPRGPIHRNEQKVAYLGECITSEDEADNGLDEDGINNINPASNTPNEDNCDDGVIFPVSMPQCRWSTFNYKVRVVQPNSDFWINVWCDWNRDGDWDDTINDACASIPEWAVQNRYVYGLSTGVHELTTPAFMSWHPKSGTTQIWMRITLSDQPWTGGSGTGYVGNGGSGPLDGYEYGETEDLYFIPDTTASVCQDFNGDGVIDQDDLSTFIDDWLANCQ